VITFPQRAVQSFPVGWDLKKLFCTFSLLVVQGFCRILPDFRGAEQPSLPLKALMAKDFRLVQQALSKDYELLPETSESMIYTVMIRLMLKRLAQFQAIAEFD
jgi:hypothetical protein